MTGAACGVLWLTYGLYLLRHNAEIQERLLHRLRSPDPVQVFAAVHEVMVATAMIRAGFELKLEDEGDGSVTHCEFTATSKLTGKQFSVEAKVCDPDRKDGRIGRPRVVRQLSRSLSKAADHPRIVCIDLNRPVPVGVTQADVVKLLTNEVRRIRAQAGNLKIRGQPAPPAYVVLSIFSFRYDLEGTHQPRAALLEGFKIPRLTIGTAFTSLREFAEFRAEHADPARFVQELAQMEIPTTLDGSLPSRAFGEPSQPILIGERYLVSDKSGSEVAGELMSAVMNETEMKVMAVLRMDDGRTIIAEMPVTHSDLNLYRESPETFFGAYNPRGQLQQPVELYEWLLSVYQQTPRDRLLELLAGRGEIEKYRNLPQLELAKIYAEGIALAIVAQGEGPPAQGAS
jgi:hypothetical protein